MHPSALPSPMSFLGTRALSTPLASYRVGYKAYEASFGFLDKAFDEHVMVPRDFQQCTGTLVFYSFVAQMQTPPSLNEYKIDDALVLSDAFWSVAQTLAHLYDMEVQLDFDMRFITCNVANATLLPNFQVENCHAESKISNALSELPRGPSDYADRVQFTQADMTQLANTYIAHRSRLPTVSYGTLFSATAFMDLLFVVHSYKLGILLGTSFDVSSVFSLVDGMNCPPEVTDYASAKQSCSKFVTLASTHYTDIVPKYQSAYAH